MRTKVLVASIIAVGIIIGLGVFAAMMKAEPVSAEKAFPEEAQSWIKSISDTSDSYKKHEAVLLELQEKVKKEAVDRDTDATTARGLRQSLCSKYKIVVDASGKANEVTACPDFL